MRIQKNVCAKARSDGPFLLPGARPGHPEAQNAPEPAREAQNGVDSRSGILQTPKELVESPFPLRNQPARRRSAPGPENQIPIPCRRHPRRCRHRHGPRTPASWCRCRATPRPSSGRSGPVTVDRESRWRGSGSARGCSLLTPEGVGSTNAALSIEPSLRRPIRSKTSAVHTGTVGRNGLTQRISLLAVCRGRKREIG